MNKRAVGHNQRPTPLTAVVVIGSWQADAWNKWLVQRSLPELKILGLRINDGMIHEYDMPWSSPPLDGDEIAEGVAKSYVRWAVKRISVKYG